MSRPQAEVLDDDVTIGEDTNSSSTKAVEKETGGG